MNLSGDHQHPFETWNWICLYLWLHYTGNCKSPVGVPDFKKVNDNNVIQIPLKKCTFDNDLNGWHSIAIFVVLKCFYQICGGFLKKRLFCVWKCQTTVMFQDLFSHKYRMICVDISQNAPIATAGACWAVVWSKVCIHKACPNVVQGVGVCMSNDVRNPEASWASDAKAKSGPHLYSERLGVFMWPEFLHASKTPTSSVPLQSPLPIPAQLFKINVMFVLWSIFWPLEVF